MCHRTAEILKKINFHHEPTFQWSLPFRAYNYPGCGKPAFFCTRVSPRREEGGENHGAQTRLDGRRIFFYFNFDFPLFLRASADFTTRPCTSPIDRRSTQIGGQSARRQNQRATGDRPKSAVDRRLAQIGGRSAIDRRHDQRSLILAL